jgi:hypothetical protein
MAEIVVIKIADTNEWQNKILRYKSMELKIVKLNTLLLTKINLSPCLGNIESQNYDTNLRNQLIFQC